MTDATGIGRRSDSLYFGHDIHRRELCDMVAHLEADLGSERERCAYYKRLAAHLAERLRGRIQWVVRRTDGTRGDTVDVSVKLDEGAFLPVRAHDTDAGADIMTPKGFVLSAKSSAVIRTGVHVQLPDGTAGILKSKSGLNVNHDIIGEGVIDEGYSGEIVVKLYNLGHVPHSFRAGDKIIQLLIVPVTYCGFAQADEVQGGERGDGGFGSTGR